MDVNSAENPTGDILEEGKEETVSEDQAEERRLTLAGIHLGLEYWSWAQTMNYVGQLAGQVFVTVKELYRGLNPATLSGCIDVIVVRQPNGNLQCSPFHVRFGKMGVLRSREKVVDIEINGECVDLHMKLGDNGEAFFVEEMEDNEVSIPSYLATSPILLEGAALMESQLKRNSMDWTRSGDQPGTSHAGQAGTENSSNSSVKKRRKRRRKSRLDNVKREENGDTTEDEDMFPIEMSSDEETEALETARSSVQNSYSDRTSEMRPPQVSSFPILDAYPHSDGEWSPIQSKSVKRRESSSHLLVPSDGGLSSSCPQQSSFLRASDSPPGSRPATPKSDSELVSKPLDRGLQTEPPMHWAWGELPQAKKSSPHKSKDAGTVSISMSEKTHFRTIPSASDEGKGLPRDPDLDKPVLVTIEDVGPDSVLNISEFDPGSLGAAAALLPAEEDISPMTTGSHHLPSKTDSPSKKKDKRSRHLGTDGVYLDDITCMDPEVAALYFPKSGEASTSSRSTSENGARSENQSPQSVGSSGGDSGVESISDGIRDLPSIAISLCGGLSDNKEITKEQFLEQVVTYQQFVENPAIIDDPNLVIKIGNKYFNWPTAAPLLLAMQAFQKPLPKVTVDTLMRDKMPKKGGRWWFSWRGRNTNIKEAKPEEGLNGSGEQAAVTGIENRIKDESSSSDEDPRAAKQNIGSLQSTQTLLSSSGITYKKTLRLSSDQLKSLKLKSGPNDVVFSVTTQYQGTCRCEGTIYLWNWDDKIVISDIDGTITRSDTLGHILPTLGKDWTHQGIAKLYHKVSQNGYKFLYCSARAIGMADMTRGYLHWVNERGTVLPQGPVLLSPSSLFSALHREVIEKKPEKFKIECLTDIKNLFLPNLEPFYAAFGNRATDVCSYKQVGVSLNRIFTVNPKGELIQEHAKTNISSYVRLCEVVDHIFPLLKRSHSSDFPCSDTYSQFTYWREPLPPFENQDIHPPAS
ncbi:phosphatidate phosphatase LPIN1 isoform X2 [Spea bombifrons]|uniref:phosphatidate phosphatase LPIN1 isoform X2 n=1 Tax=Spea bombifrons TaxID=233779 RepID=UPI0023498CC4|nr:phosphatidate phosphatase LPIN1 isoform X2 [Spea bombifrons]